MTPRLLLATARLNLYRDGRVFVRDVDTEEEFVPGYALGCFKGPEADDFRLHCIPALLDPDEFETVASAWQAHCRDAESPRAAEAEWSHLYLTTRGVQ